MNYFDQAQQLVKNCRHRLSTLSNEYKSSVEDQEVKPELLIEIKNFLENLRSALDYSAQGLVQEYGTKPKNLTQIQFPYATQSEDINKFRAQVERRLPGVAANRPDILTRIELAQHFYGPGNNWLLGFMALTNENKHRFLTPQNYKQFIELNFTIDLPVNSTTEIPWPPHPDGPGQTVIEKFSTFAFTSNGQPVIRYLEMTLDQIENLIENLSIM